MGMIRLDLVMGVDTIMTREEFLENTTDFDELVYFCNEYGYYEYVEDIMDSESFDNWLDEKFADDLSHYSWREIRDEMNDVPEGYDWYRIYDGYYGLTDDDFSEILQEVLERCDDDEFWDHPEEDDIDSYVDDDILSEEEIVEEEEVLEIEDEASMLDMFASTSSFIKQEYIEPKEEDVEAAGNEIDMLLSEIEKLKEAIAS